MVPIDPEKLRNALEKAADGLPAVRRRRMFGCDALFADAQIFALVWKEGRIGIKLTDGRLFEELIAMAGADPWKAGGAIMADWILVPPKMHDDGKLLRRWVERAHAGATAVPEKTARGPSGKTTGKTTRTRR